MTFINSFGFWYICARAFGQHWFGSGLVPVWHQATTWTIADIALNIRPLEMHFNVKLFKIQTSLFSRIPTFCVWSNDSSPLFRWNQNKFQIIIQKVDAIVVFGVMFMLLFANLSVNECYERSWLRIISWKFVMLPTEICDATKKLLDFIKYHWSNNVFLWFL